MAASEERGKKVLRRMSAQHLDLLRDLGAKNKDKEDQQRREEHRQEKRASSVRERTLTTVTKSSQEPASGVLPELLPAEPADGLKNGEPRGSQEEQRAWQIKCNQDIERRQTEVIQRLQEVQRVKNLKREREKLKGLWRAHKAKSYLLEKCQNAEMKAYLESKEKPKALPKIPSSISAASLSSKKTGGSDLASCKAADEAPLLRPWRVGRGRALRRENCLRQKSQLLLLEQKRRVQRQRLTKRNQQRWQQSRMATSASLSVG